MAGAVGHSPHRRSPMWARVLALLVACQEGLSQGFPLPPDTRPPGCGAQVADEAGLDFRDLKVSIIIPYRRESWEHIEGSVQSVLHFTPRHLIEEILFVSDGNQPETMFVHELRQLSDLINLLVLPSRGVGLIEAKMRAVGAVSPTSTVLVFLEPHIRVNRQWLEPLLSRIRRHPRVLAMPALDPIPQDDFSSYHHASSGHWRFEWNFNLIYTNPLHRTASSDPYLSPATSGGIFAIRRDWWDTLGFYDHGMLGWGGDHVEATMKVWRCGGHIEVVPCSRIGHLFRDPDHRPYAVEVSQVVRNYARMAAIWMDEHIDGFRKVKPDTIGLEIGDISAQQQLREQLQCKNMSWYLKNVDREMQWEKDHICVPGCSHAAICCKSPAAHGRSTIDRTIPFAEYRPLPHPDLLVQQLQHEEL